MSERLVDIQPVGRRVSILPGQSLLEAAQRAGVELVSICGGMGICEGCRVRLVDGELAPLTLEEQASLTGDEIAQGFRLACQAVPMGDVRIDVPLESLTAPQRLQLEGRDLPVALSPAVRPVEVQISPPSLNDLQADDARLLEALSKAGLPSARLSLGLLPNFSSQLRELGWKARLAVRTLGLEPELVAILPPKAIPSLAELASGGTSPLDHPQPSTLLGLAVDIGTTKLAAYLLDLETGHTLASQGAMNPQIAYGEDVISRILYTDQNPGGRELLQRKLVDVLNQLLDGLCEQSGARPEQVVDAVLVGNTAMHHLFAGLPVHQLGVSPYVPAVSDPLDLRAAQLGLHLAPGAWVHLPPNVAGYVGADHVAMLLGAGIAEAAGGQRVVVALDIGTNTEISLAGRGRLLSCSTASGPAFEGAHIQNGMRAAPGAIERVQIIEGAFHLQTISGEAPVGLCGSGILDTIAALLAHGAVDARGNLRSDHPMVRSADGGREVLLVPAAETGTGRELVVTRKDINEIQLAKGAIRTGIEVLLKAAGLTAEQVDEWVIAGAFGTYLDVHSALRVGMFPPVPAGRFRQVGNAAGSGARQMLLSAQARQSARQLARQIEYLELTVVPGFADHFMHAIMFEYGGAYSAHSRKVG